MDGQRRPRDWIVDPVLRPQLLSLVDEITALIALNSDLEDDDNDD